MGMVPQFENPYFCSLMLYNGKGKILNVYHDESQTEFHLLNWLININLNWPRQTIIHVSDNVTSL